MSYTRFGVIALAALIPCASPAGATQVQQGAAQQYAGTIVPHVVGRTLDEAQVILAKAGLRVVKVLKDPTSTGKPGTVVKQDPSPETPVARNSDVSLTVAVAAPVDSIAVPDLIGSSRDQALGLLERYRLSGRPIRAAAVPDKVGLVVEQDPRKDVRVAIGSEVRLWYGVPSPISEPPAPPPSTPTVVEVIPVPDLLQHTLWEARQRVEAVGLEIAVSDPTRSGDAGLVVRQSPEANQLVPRRTRVRVALAAPPIIVPDVVGRLQREAEESIRVVGLVPQPRYERSGRRPGTVLSQSPNPGESVARGRTVAFAVATSDPDETVSGPEPEPPTQRRVDSVPDVVGQPPETATAAFGRVGVPVVSVDTIQQDGGLGRVFAQQPLARTPVQVGAQGSLIVTVPIRLVDVPDVRGMDLARATTVLETARLASGTVQQLEKPGPPGIVIAQDPNAGGQVRPMTSVSLTVTRTVVRVPVPSLLHLTRAEAIATLHRSNLKPGVISPTPSPTAATVVDQAPTAHATVRPGSKVNFTLAAATPTPPPAMVAVPSVVGLSAGDAERLLSSASLTMARRDSLLGYGADSVVLDQRPAAGDSLPARSVVQVLVGQGRPIPWFLIMVSVAGVSGLGAGGALTWRWLKHRLTGPTPSPDRPHEPELTPPVVGFEAAMGTGKAALSSDRERVTGHELQLEPLPAALGSRVLVDERFFRELP